VMAGVQRNPCVHRRFRRNQDSQMPVSPMIAEHA
jgi:hypothetical protein